MINRLNPLYLLISVLFLSILSIYFKTASTALLQEEAKSLEALKTKIETVLLLEKKYKFDNKRVSKIVNNSRLNKDNLKISQTKKRYKIEYSTDNYQDINFITNKILNSTVAIDKLSIATTENIVKLQIEITK